MNSPIFLFLPNCAVLTDPFDICSFYFNSGRRTRPNGRDRHSPPLSSRSGYKGWPVCRCHHCDLPRLSVQWPIGQIRCCHDRRDYTSGPGAAGKFPPASKMNHINLAADIRHTPDLRRPLITAINKNPSPKHCTLSRRCNKVLF